MAEYDLDEYEDGEDDVGEYEEEEEDPLPTQEEIEFNSREKMEKDLRSDLGSSREKKNKMPYDNFGSFFGPSQPVIAQRVIQESRSLLENPHLAERISKAKNANKGGSSTSVSKPRPNGQRPLKVSNSARPKAKIQMLKNTRDYSFLLSDDAEVPIPQKNPPNSVPPPKPVRKPLPASSQTRLKPGQQSQRPKPGQQSQRPSTACKMPSTSLDSRKSVGRNEGSRPGRPSAQKPVPSKMLMVVNKSRVIPPPVSRGCRPTGHKPQPSRPPPPLHKKPLEHKKDDKRPTVGNVTKKPLVSSKPQIKQQPARPPTRPQQKVGLQKRPARPFDDDDDDGDKSVSMIRNMFGYKNVTRKPLVSSKPQIKQQPARPQQKVGLQRRPARPFDDDDDDDDGDGDKAISMIRNMFGYNPNRYRAVNDDDDSDMEANFDDIMMEEKRSARIAAKEDEEELKKIEEEERRERLRKAAKKRKLRQ